MPSNSNSGQKFISRNRKPRVHITYEDPYDAEKLIELHFVKGVSLICPATFPGRKASMNDRKFPHRHGQFRQAHGGDRAACR
jgi:type VI secretion system protein ImpB